MIWHEARVKCGGEADLLDAIEKGLVTTYKDEDGTTMYCFRSSKFGRKQRTEDTNRISTDVKTTKAIADQAMHVQFTDHQLHQSQL